MPYLREPINGLTHCLGAFLAFAGGFVLFNATLPQFWHRTSFVIYIVSMVLLYTSSTLYHWLPLSQKGTRLWRRIDHCMIFIYIAGSYTPVCLITLHGTWGWALLGCAWGTATLGVMVKCFWMNAPRWLSTALYLAMGWMVLAGIYPLMQALPTGALLWLLAGGLLYSMGAVIYASKWPTGAKHFGFHEIFHVFVMAGSLCHFWVMYAYIAPMPLPWQG